MTLEQIEKRLRSTILRIPADQARVFLTNQNQLENKYILDIKDVTPTLGAAYNQSSYKFTVQNKSSMIVYETRKEALVPAVFHKSVIRLENLSLDASSIEFETPAANTFILLEITYLDLLTNEVVR